MVVDRESTGPTENSSSSLTTLLYEMTRGRAVNKFFVFSAKCWTKYFSNIQSTLVISNSKGLAETIGDIRTSTYQISELRENNSNNHM